MNSATGVRINNNRNLKGVVESYKCSLHCVRMKKYLILDVWSTRITEYLLPKNNKVSDFVK